MKALNSKQIDNSPHKTAVAVSGGLKMMLDEYLSTNDIGPRKRGQVIDEAINEFLDGDYWVSQIIERTIDSAVKHEPMMITLKKGTVKRIEACIKDWNAMKEDPKTRLAGNLLSDEDKTIDLNMSDFIRMGIMYLVLKDEF